jgi:hypothetical protein
VPQIQRTLQQLGALVSSLGRRSKRPPICTFTQKVKAVVRPALTRRATWLRRVHTGDARKLRRGTTNQVSACLCVGAGRTEGLLQRHGRRCALDGKRALGIPAPSTSDVQLFKGLAERLGLRKVWVTSGMYTGVVHSENLGQFSTRE